MTDLLTYRGPDDRGVFFDPQAGLGLGHRRLSIIDLSSAGHQPMTIGPLTIIFNGELYNYLELRRELEAAGCHFTTATDTEVIVRAFSTWGKASVEKFNGMWAFALWDSERRTLFCCRDRFGVKPLYYSDDGGLFACASEIKALLLRPGARRAADPAALFQFLAGPWAYVETADQTFVRGVKQLPAGHWLEVGPAGVTTVQRYWHPSLNGRASSHDEALEEFSSLFDDAVRLRLRSDVPVGACLSGGLDSAAVTWMARQALGHSYKTFTFSSAPEPEDESPFASACAEAFGLDNVRILLDPAAAPTLVEQVLWHHDAPYADASVLAQWLVMRTVHEHGIKVVLVGQGADETLAGYPKFLPFRLAGLLVSGRWRDAARERREMIASPLGRGLDLSWPAVIRHAGSWSLSGMTKRRAPVPAMPSHLNPAAFDARAWVESPLRMGHTPLQQELYSSLTASPLPALLRNDDRNSMAHSVESRAPFMDYRLVSFCLGLSDDLKVSGGRTKALLRAYLEGKAPDVVAHRKDKKGFSTPLARWLRGPLREWAADLLASAAFRQRGLFIVPEMDRLWREHQAGTVDRGLVLWRVLNVELWHRLFADGPAMAPRP